MSREPDQSSLLARALAPLAGLSAGVLCSQLSDFLKQVALVGGTAAVAGLSGPMTWTVLAVVGLFGVTEAWRSSEQKKKARRLAERLDKLADRQDTALAMLHDIADGKTGVTLDGISTREFGDRIIAGLHSAGLATTEQVARLRKELSAARVEDRIYHNTADLLLREIRESLETLHATLGGRLPAPPPPNNNFTDAGIQPNLDFVGREQVLRDLHAQLSDSDVAITHAVSGEGGIGKTQVAIRYAFEHAADYDGRWWLDASKEAIAGQIAALARTLGIPLPPEAKPEQIRRAVCERLSQGKHLVVLDNLERLADLDGFTLPEPSRVLVTTRHTDLPTARVRDFPLDVLRRDASLDLLRKHRDDLAGPEHEKALSRVADQLGDHALALALAASYLRKRPNVDPAELLERLQRDDVGDEAHPFQSLTTEDHTAGYQRSVYASLSLHLPDFRDTPAMNLLALAAHCHPDAIPLDLFFNTSDEAQETVEDRLEQLGDVSIVRYAGTVSIHRLMQEVVRAELDETGRRRTLTALVGLLADRFEDPEDYRNWAGQGAYAAHAQAALAHAETLADIPRTAFLGNQLGLYLQERARLDDALAALRTAERIDRAAFGDDHPEVAAVVNNIGSVHKAKGDLDGALKCYREAERIDRAAFGDDHPNVAVRVNNIGAVLRDKGDLDGALRCFREAEQIDRATLGDNHPKVALRVNNIGAVLKAQGDLVGALKCYREAERIDRAAFGDEHPKVAICVNNIGSVLRAKDDLDGAMKCYREAERIDRAAFGDDHPDVATDVNNIGGLLLAKGDRDGALKCGREAFRICLSTLGPRALNTLTSAKNVGALGIDPLALAREIAGEQVAEELRRALAEHDAS